MQYEARRIVRRERIEALLAPVGSFTLSDVNVKANIAPVVWY